MSELKIKGTNEAIQVQNVFCIGKNYLDHIKEFDTPEKAAEIPAVPVLFMKPNTAVMTNGRSVTIPSVDGKKISDDLQYEVELVIVIGKDGFSISKEKAFDHIFGYALGIDFTLRDLQNMYKKKGLPWPVSKGFYGSAPITEVVRKEDSLDPEDIRISLLVNEELKQDARTSEMMFKIDFMVHYVSSIFGLKRGDIIFTGTPAGPSKLNTGDKIKAMLEGIGELNITVE